MKLSKRVQACELSPMRKFHPFAVEAQAKGRKIYHLNIGQPDIATPEVYFDAVRNFASPVLAYAESPGVPSYLAAVQAYYDRLGAHYDESEILATTGGSEALSILMQCILDPGSEVLIPEPFYPNYATFICAAFGSIRPIPTSPEEGYHYADRALIEPLINENTRAILITNPSNPTGVILTAEERQMLLELAREHGKRVICIAELQAPGRHELTEINTYYGVGLRPLLASWEVLADRFDYSGLSFSYHYYAPLLELLEDGSGLSLPESPEA